ncbi:hypothetical protein B296_00045149 [Ensete ventricosum]|uniref:Uncharacterized protein n=1 Tax=Ensete ventricosum TaxID=4639 RepID=A0A426Y0K0_ENSVE|nr:hypothetical protein B296_00045149 [Ensete ventricosum]
MAFSSSFAPSGAFYHDPSSLTASIGSPRIGSVEVRALAFRSNLNPAPALASSPKEAAFLASFLARGDGGFAQKRKLSCFAGLDGGNGAGDDGGTGDRAGGGGGGDEGDGEDGSDEAEFGPVMKFEEVIRETEARGASLPPDLLEAAKSIGIRRVLLSRYLDLQVIWLGHLFARWLPSWKDLTFSLVLFCRFKGSWWPLGVAIRHCSLLRNRMLADPSFLFKVATEKRGKDFWAEFELYAADLLVGIVVDIALVGLLAPYVRIGRPSVSASTGFLGSLKRGFEALPSSSLFLFLTVFLKPKDQAANLLFSNGLGHTFTRVQIDPIWLLDLEVCYTAAYHSVQMLIPDESACNSGVFLAVSSNTRYQIVNGLERVVEASPFAKRIPPIAMAFTVGVRFANNIYGGMQFVDWARWSGVQ